MKARIIGIAFVLTILAALVVLTEGDNQAAPSSTSQPSEPAFQPLKIN
jgi:hypothetical protein